VVLFSSTNLTISFPNESDDLFLMLYLSFIVFEEEWRNEDKMSSFLPACREERVRVVLFAWWDVEGVFAHF
jgi:hypothetical protein